METEPSEIQIAIVKVKEEPSSDTEEQMDEGGRESGGSRGGGEAEVDGCLREVKTEDMSAMTED